MACPGGDVVQSRHRYPGAVQPQLAFHHPPVGVQRRVAGVFPAGMMYRLRRTCCSLPKGLLYSWE